MSYTLHPRHRTTQGYNYNNLYTISQKSNRTRLSLHTKNMYIITRVYIHHTHQKQDDFFSTSSRNKSKTIQFQSSRKSNKYMVKCLVFEIRTCFPVLAPKSGKQDVQTGPGQGRHLPSLLDEKIARRLPGLTTVSLRDRFWRFQPNRSSPPRGLLRNYFTKFRTRPPSYPPPT